MNTNLNSLCTESYIIENRKLEKSQSIIIYLIVKINENTKLITKKVLMEVKFRNKWKNIKEMKIYLNQFLWFSITDFQTYFLI